MPQRVVHDGTKTSWGERTLKPPNSRLPQLHNLPVLASSKGPCPGKKWNCIKMLNCDYKSQSRSSSLGPYTILCTTGSPTQAFDSPPSRSSHPFTGTPSVFWPPQIPMLTALIPLL